MSQRSRTGPLIRTVKGRIPSLPPNLVPIHDLQQLVAVIVLLPRNKEYPDHGRALSRAPGLDPRPMIETKIVAPGHGPPHAPVPGLEVLTTETAMTETTEQR